MIGQIIFLLPHFQLAYLAIDKKQAEGITDAAYDADYVLIVTTVLDDDPECFSRVSSGPLVSDPLTRRPILGQLQLCRLDNPAPFAIFLQDVIRGLFSNLVRRFPPKHVSCTTRQDSPL